MLEHGWRIVVFLYALGEALHLADRQDAAGAWWWWAPVDVFFASLFAGCAVWNVCLAIRTLFSDPPGYSASMIVATPLDAASST